MAWEQVGSSPSDCCAKGVSTAPVCIPSQGRPARATGRNGECEGGRAADVGWAIAAASCEGKSWAATMPAMTPRTAGYVSLSDHPVPPSAPRHSPLSRQHCPQGGSMQVWDSLPTAALPPRRTREEVSGEEGECWKQGGKWADTEAPQRGQDRLGAGGRVELSEDRELLPGKGFCRAERLVARSKVILLPLLPLPPS